MAPPPNIRGRNQQCWFGSGRKLKKCHPAGRSTVDVQRALIKTFENPDPDRLLDPNAVVDAISASTNPVLLVDERRVDSGGDPFVFFSVVALAPKLALAAQLEVAAAARSFPRAARMTGGRLLRENASDAIFLRNAVQAYLSAGMSLRAGATYESLRNWRRTSTWPGLVTKQRNVRLKSNEYVVIQQLATDCINALRLEGLLVMIVDKSTQNGLDQPVPNRPFAQLGGISFDVPGTRVHLMINATTPEDELIGALVRMPDLDAAAAVGDARFSQFTNRVRTAERDGTLVYWPHTFPPIPGARTL